MGPVAASASCRSDLLIRRPKNLFPVQIENVLTAHPAIVEAAAVAVPDARYGELVGAWIVRHPHEPALSREEVRRTVAIAMNPQVRHGAIFPNGHTAAD